MPDILAQMSVVLGADITEFRQAMATAKSELKGLVQFGEALKGVGESMSMYLTLPIALAGVEAVKAFDKQAQAVAQVENGLRSTGNAAKLTSDQLQDLASKIQQKSVYGDEEVLQKVTTQLLTFSNISGDTFKRTQQAAVDLSAKLGQDLQTSAIQLGKALNDPTQSLGALRRAGISFSNDQIALIHHLQATNQLGQAQTLILGELERQYGGTAEAAARTGAGPIRQLGNQLHDLLEGFGKIILEAINPFIEKLRTLVAAFDDLEPATKKTIVEVLAFAAAMGPVLFIVGTLITILPALRAGIILLTGSFSTLILPILGVAAVVALVVYEIYQHWDQLVDYFTKGEGGALFADLATAAKEAVAAVKSAFASLVSAIGKDSLGSMIDFGTILKAVFKEIALGVTAALNVITDAINLITNLFKKDWAGAFESAKKAVTDLMVPLENLLGLVGTKSKTSIGDFFHEQFDAASKAADEYYMKDADKAMKAGQAKATIADTFDKAAAAAAKKLAAEFAKLNQELRTNAVLAANLPAFYKGEGGYDAAAERIKILTNGLKQLVADGLNPASAAFQRYLKELLTLSQAPDAKLADKPMLGRTTGVDTLAEKIPVTLSLKKVDFGFDIFKQALQTSDAFKQIDNEALAFGESAGVASAKASALRSAMQSLLAQGVSPLAPQIKALKEQMDEFALSSVDLGKMISGGLADSFVLLGQTIGSALVGSTSSFSAFLDGFVSILGKFLGDFGQQLIEAGVARIALDDLLVTPGSGPLAIAAGVALVALSGIASASLSKGPSGSGGGGSAPSAPRAATAFTPTQAPVNSYSGPSTTTHTINVQMAGSALRGVLQLETDRLGRVVGYH